MLIYAGIFWVLPDDDDDEMIGGVDEGYLMTPVQIPSIYDRPHRVSC